MKRGTKEKNQRIISIILRYAIIILLAIFFPLFYLIFAPLTIYPVSFFLNIFYKVGIDHMTLIVNQGFINLVDACIAGSAYFLLILLNLSVPNMKKRFLAVSFEISSFLVLNIIRIAILSILFLSNFAYFMQAHLISWYFLTAIIVILIWIATIKIFKIKEIPFYSDFKLLRKLAKNRR